jgi:hypothetical protein
MLEFHPIFDCSNWNCAGVWLADGTVGLRCSSGSQRVQGPPKFSSGRDGRWCGTQLVVGFWKLAVHYEELVGIALN